jgi:hypothetical protein
MINRIHDVKQVVKLAEQAIRENQTVKAFEYIQSAVRGLEQIENDFGGKE